MSSRQQRGQHGRRRRQEHRLLITLLLLLVIWPLLVRAGGGAAPPRAAVAVAMSPWLHAATAAAAGRRQGPQTAFWVSAARYGSSSTRCSLSRRAPWCLLHPHARQQQQQQQGRPRRLLQPVGQPGAAPLYRNALVYSSSFSSSTTALSAVSGKGAPSSPPHPAEWLLSGVQAVKGVGPSAKEALKKLGITTVLDLLLHLPVGIFDWGELKLVREMQEGETVAVAVRVTGHNDGGGGRRPLTIYTVDAEGQPLDLIFFLAKPHLRHFYLRRFPPNSVHKLAGRASKAKYTGRMTLSHPEAVKGVGVEGEEAGGATDGGASMPVEPVYRLTSGLNANKLRDFQREALRSLQALAKEPTWDDWLDDGRFLQGKGWPSFHEALRAAHSPATLADLEPTSPARARLAFDELLATQLPTALRRAKERAGAEADGVVKEEEGVDGYLTAACEAQLPFTMTAGQRQAVQEIWGDLAARRRGGRMVRLLQGDVGSGKTVCAVLAMLRAVELGGQGALLAPTEILAFQHQQTVEGMCAGLQVRVPNGEGEVTTRPLRVEVLTSSKGRGKARRLLLEALKAGEIDVLVGTHALLGDDVVFNRLGLVVIDEEHRFGVRQRERLSNETSVLYMSATPIPRTLLLSSYGDMEVSRLEEAPSRDVTVTTTIFALTNVGEIAQRLHRKLLDSPQEKVFWVLPCIDGDGGGRRGGGGDKGEGEGGSVMSVVRRYEALVALMGEEKVRMVHGRMDGSAKLKALQDFADGAANVLVSTSVIEVGVDVPAATVCIVEHAELFGLSQLHQLRGRIGRATTTLEDGFGGDGGGARECYCVLTYDDESPGREKALQRLMTLKHTTDGFEIAEQDLRLRGPGEIMGSRQSGHTGFRLVDLVKHADLLEEAHALAQTHALRMTTATGNGEDDASLNALLRLFSNNEEGAAPSVTTKSKAASAVSSTAATTTTTTRATRTRGGAAKGETVTTMTTSTTSTASTSSLPLGATPFPPSSVTTVVSVPSQLEGWTTTVYGDRYEVYSPPPPPEEDGPMNLAALAARTRAAAVASSFAVTTTTTTTKGPNGNGDVWGSFYPQPEVPRVAIDLEAVDTTFVLFDLETTGLNAERERIIQVAAKVLTPASWGAAEDEEEGDDDAAVLTTDGDDDPLLFNAYVNPGFEVPAKITEITGISTALLLQEGARPFEQVWPAFCQWLDGVRAGKPVVLVAHNAAFDHKMLAFDLRRCGWDAARAFRGENGRHLVGMMDTLAVFRSDELWSRREGDGLPPKPSSFKQESLYRYLIGRELRDAHNARGDVMGLEALLSHPFVRRKWRGVGSASVLEMGGWVEGVDDVVVVVGEEAEASSKKAPVVLEGSGSGGGGGGPGLSATRPSAAASGGNGGSGRSGGYGAAAASSGAGANKKGMMATRRRATTEDGAAC